MARRKGAKASAPQIPEPFSEAEVKLIRQLFLDGLSLEEVGAKFERLPVEVAEVIRAGAGASLACSFCGRGHKDVVLLIAGPLAYICNDCLDMCIQVVSDERPEMLNVRIGLVDKSQEG